MCTLLKTQWSLLLIVYDVLTNHFLPGKLSSHGSSIRVISLDTALYIKRGTGFITDQ